MSKIKLILENGSVYFGKSFGYNKSVSSEIVFSTNMTGYIESLTDPSFCDQILCLTYPIVGNYGVPNLNDKDEYGILKHLESKQIWIKGLLVQNYSDNHSHFSSNMSLSDWLVQNKIPALTDIDTRKLTQELRNNGILKGKIIFNDEKINFIDININNLVSKVSTNNSYTIGNGDIHIGVIDCGIKFNILRELINQGFKITVLPYDYDFTLEDYDGIFLSNGPGDPKICSSTIKNIKTYINTKCKPLFGICLGNQLLSLATGAKTYKMKFGNRGFNQPVFMKDKEKTYITSQNHGYAVDTNTLPNDWEEWCINKNDGSNEGIKHKTKPFRSVQFHPEARGGPRDTEFLFKDFYDDCCNYKYGSIHKKKIILLGSGGLSIGQAGEFDYSGSQAIKSFKDRGYSVILVNPNIATIQTTEGFADEVYYVPVEPDFLKEIIIKERPQFISLSFGGQTALNCGIKLFHSGILNQYNIKVLGTSVDNILKTEDRDLFSKEMTIIGEEVPKSMPATSLEEAIEVAENIGYPVLVRAAFALGGLGSGFCHNKDELIKLLKKTFTKTDQVLIDEDLRGWKEVEYEVMRDKYGNSITVCNMENFDPLGIHTGDSIVVAPSQTLNNDEYNMLRTASLRIADTLGIIGECNVQMTLDPHSNNYKIIEVNPRLSRSSALASKATGYPIASVAARLCLGEKLYDINNVVTGNTTANFEPSLDYIVVKIPRWDTRKFRGVDPKLGSAMKSVGEIMAIGRSFEEAFQKGLRMVSSKGFEKYGNSPTLNEIKKELKNPTDDRVRILAHTLFDNILSIDEIHEISKIDKWFLQKLKNIVLCYDYYENINIENLDKNGLLELKKNGYSDRQISNIYLTDEQFISKKRYDLGIGFYIRQIDTLAGEYPTETNYLYTSYHGDSDDIEITNKTKKIIILGSGTYRIGSSVEFDYCSVKSASYFRKQGYETIMINYNPETMSTDFDNSDKLYFEELSFESVYDIYTKEKAYGIIVSMGGQEPNNIAYKLYLAGCNILGTHPGNIDKCENRSKYSTMLDTLKIEQPEWLSASNTKDINQFIEKNGYPLLVRPSYVLSGAAMRIVNNKKEMDKCLKDAVDISPEFPVVITKFINGCREVDVDAVASSGNIITYAISEHLENAGVHSGDATLVLPSYSIKDEAKKNMIDRISKIAKTLEISGIFNTQFLVKDEWIGVIETNLRASRSIPFVSKTLDIDFIELACEAMLGKYLEVVNKTPNFYGVKCPQFSFTRLPEADPLLGVEMSSTGEVACFGNTLEEAYIKSLISSRCGLKTKDKMDILVLDNTDVNLLREKGHKIITDTKDIDWKKVDLVIDTSCSNDTKNLRRNAVDFSKYLVTNEQQVKLLSSSLETKLMVEPYSFYKYRNQKDKRNINIFVRQGFTESNLETSQKLQLALDKLNYYNTEDRRITLVTGTIAESQETFKKNFELREGKTFNPTNFRNYRLQKLKEADAIIVFRTGLSESTVFELAYNIFKGKNIPIFYAIDEDCDIKTTLLRDLNGFNNAKVVYKKIIGGISEIDNDPDFIDFINNL